jgi:hypothetical protein
MSSLSFQFDVGLRIEDRKVGELNVRVTKLTTSQVPGHPSRFEEAITDI